MLIENRLQELGVELSTPKKPIASYKPIVQVDNLLFLSGQDCSVNGEFIYSGKLGDKYTVEQGKEAAKQCVVNALSILKHELGDLDKIKRFVKVLAFVNSTDDFYEQPFVVNGASDFLEEVFGEKGKHARSAIGTNVLPFNIPVEIEFVVEIENL